VSLSFLDKNRSYTAQVYRDGDDAHWKTNPYSIVIEEQEVNADSTLKLMLAAGGGTAIRLKAGERK
jgi:alpha-glucosidase